MVQEQRKCRDCHNVKINRNTKEWQELCEALGTVQFPNEDLRADVIYRFLESKKAIIAGKEHQLSSVNQIRQGQMCSASQPPHLTLSFSPKTGQ